MISNDVIRGYTDIIILNLLLQNDSYGYEISRQIRKISEEKYAWKKQDTFSLMRVVKLMEKRGSIIILQMRDVLTMRTNAESGLK